MIFFGTSSLLSCRADLFLYPNPNPLMTAFDVIIKDLLLIISNKSVKKNSKVL